MPVFKRIQLEDEKGLVQTEYFQFNTSSVGPWSVSLPLRILNYYVVKCRFRDFQCVVFEVWIISINFPIQSQKNAAASGISITRGTSLKSPRIQPTETRSELSL